MINKGAQQGGPHIEAMNEDGGGVKRRPNDQAQHNLHNKSTRQVGDKLYVMTTKMEPGGQKEKVDLCRERNDGGQRIIGDRDSFGDGAAEAPAGQGITTRRRQERDI